MKSKLLIAILAAALPLLANASTKVTEKPGGWHVTPVLSSDPSAPFKTKDECVAAVRARGVGAYSCDYSTAVTVVGTCDDEPMPILKLEVNSEGFTVQPGVVVEQDTDGTWKPTKMEGLVPGPGYPKCWVPGLVPYKLIFSAAEGPPTQEPGPWVYCTDWGTPDKPPLGKECPDKAKANGGCYWPKGLPDVCPTKP